MAATLLGPTSWSMQRNTEGHRTYDLTHKIKCLKTEGPATALQTPGLPVPGSVWIVDDDVDLWAFCTQEATVKAMVDGEPNTHFLVTQKFSTRPNPRCQDAQFEDPLLEPAKLSGGSISYTEEATEDRFGAPIRNSAFEQFRGAQVEFDANRPTVRVQKNYPTLGADVWAPMENTLNDAPLWGLPARCWKLSRITWDQQYFGQCEVYYTITYEFDAYVKEDPDTGELVSGFDRDLLDEGTKVLNGHWGRGGNEGYGWVLDNIGGVAPDPLNPAHFIRFKDRNGENTRVILNGHGIPYDPEQATSGTADDTPGSIHVEKYPESNFLLLGIPLTL